MNEYLIKTFISRLNKLGIDVTFAANYPWIYFDTINGKKVTGTFHADHGWTAFFSPVEIHGKVKFSDRREVFKKVRSML
jgi:lipoate-protein ligase A